MTETARCPRPPSSAPPWCCSTCSPRPGRKASGGRFSRPSPRSSARPLWPPSADLAPPPAAAKVTSPADLKTEGDLTRLAEVVQASDAGKQAIRGDVYIALPSGEQVQLPRSFTVLGQKFVFDSWVMAKVVFDDIEWNGMRV